MARLSTHTYFKLNPLTVLALDIDTVVEPAVRLSEWFSPTVC